MTAEAFWSAYREQLRLRGSWVRYQDNTQWTEFAKAIAADVMQAAGLQTGREYFRLDVYGYTQRSADRYDWDLRVAFEVESGPQWKDELCKLSHVVADLRVLVSYQNHIRSTAEGVLPDYVRQMGDRLHRVPGSQWLFAFGPHWKRPEERWRAFTLDGGGTVVPIEDDAPLTGREMRGK